MAEQYLVDTNTVIDYLNNKLPESTSALLDKQKILISVITRMELLAWSEATPEQISLTLISHICSVNTEKKNNSKKKQEESSGNPFIQFWMEEQPV